MQYNPEPPTYITTWGDLLCALQKLSPEQLAQPAQIVKEHPCADKVISAKPVVAIGTVDTLDLRYVRSCKDNRRHGDEIVLLVDGNPYGKAETKLLANWTRLRSTPRTTRQTRTGPGLHKS